MRKSATLDALFPTVRAGVLSATLLQPDHWWFMTELARNLEVTPSSLQRELESLVTAGFLLRRQDGRRVYFKANTESPLFPELRGLLQKTAGIIPELKAAIEKFGGRIELALLYGSIARGEERASSDIDLMVVGTLQQIDLLPVLRKLENRFRREVNVTLFSPEEFRRKLASADHFLSSVMNAKTIPLKGSLNELEETASKP
ncbi:MAG TPA: nucleotidyltransferase domain-containing protein [Acidobacteriaceae bacterium]